MKAKRLKTGVLLKAIPESPNDDYMAGSDGHVYSHTRYAGFGRKEYVDWYPLKGARHTKGYVTISMCHHNRKTTRSVHRLVCSAFHGQPNPKTLQVRHLDGNRKNNQPKNLTWGTQQQNWLDRKAHGNARIGENHPMAKLTDTECAHLKWAIQKGLCSQRQAAFALGMSPGGICYIVRSR